MAMSYLRTEFLRKHHVQGHLTVASVHGGGGRGRLTTRAFSSVWSLAPFYLFVLLFIYLFIFLQTHTRYLLRAVIRLQMKPLSREAQSLMEEAFLAMWTEYREMGLVHCMGCSKEVLY